MDWRRSPALLALGGLGLFLYWQILTTSLPDYLATVAPGAALFLAPKNANALMANAKAALTPAPAPNGDAQSAGGGNGAAPPGISSAERDRIRSWAETAAAEAPLRPSPFLVLGLLAPETDAAPFMEAAVRRSLHETGALMWLLRQRFMADQYADAAHMADLLLLVDPPSLPQVMPYLTQMAEKDDALADVNRLLATDPRWRDYVFNDLVYYIRDARTPLRLFLPLKDSPHPISDVALRIYEGFLIQHKLYSFAYDVWREFLPLSELRKTGLLFNGDFAFPLSGSPFDWTIATGAGVTMQIVPASDDSSEKSLSIEYGEGKAAEHSISQFTRLEPGAYRMSGRFKGELIGRRGLRWRVKCINAADRLGESEMTIGTARDWKEFHFDFVVPDQNCILQDVRLELDARSPSEWMVTGKLDYSDLAIEAIAAPNQAPAGEQR